jgi:hypothetical protein
MRLLQSFRITAEKEQSQPQRYPGAFSIQYRSSKEKGQKIATCFFAGAIETGGVQNRNHAAGIIYFFEPYSATSWDVFLRHQLQGALP